jgi:predicted GNAT family acetyltransferase
MLTFIIQDISVFSVHDKVQDHIKAVILLHVGPQRTADAAILKSTEKCSQAKKHV